MEEREKREKREKLQLKQIPRGKKKAQNSEEGGGIKAFLHYVTGSVEYPTDIALYVLNKLLIKVSKLHSANWSKKEADKE